ncbi:hypothetical protein ACTFIW_003071, partial [Dictyostelium discoideum]
ISRYWNSKCRRSIKLWFYRTIIKRSRNSI